MKLLLYCTKGKPYLYDQIGIRNILDKKYKTFNIKQFNGLNSLLLNGKIVAECDFEVEEISVTYADYYHEELAYDTNTLTFDELLEKSCLNNQQLDNYLYGDNGYAIHIKNLKTFNKPRELAHSTTDNDSYYYTAKDDKKFKVIRCGALIQAPQNMRYVQDYFNHKYALISIRPEWLCKILNGEKTIEVRRKILQVMKNEI